MRVVVETLDVHDTECVCAFSVPVPAVMPDTGWCLQKLMADLCRH